MIIILSLTSNSKYIPLNLFSLHLRYCNLNSLLLYNFISLNTRHSAFELIIRSAKTILIIKIDYILNFNFLFLHIQLLRIFRNFQIKVFYQLYLIFNFPYINNKILFFGNGVPSFDLLLVPSHYPLQFCPSEYLNRR